MNSLIMNNNKNKNQTNKTWTITFGECVENHAGMQKIGNTSDIGFDVKELEEAAQKAQAKGFQCEWLHLNDLLPLRKQLEAEEAQVLIVRGGARMFFDTEDEFKLFCNEVYATEPIVDKKAFMRGAVKNKHARYNLCYADEAQEADFAKGKGTIVPFEQVPLLQRVRVQLNDLLGEKAKLLFAELNFYYDHRKCYIGYHGDTERARVVGFRFGSSMSLQYRWYHRSSPVTERMETMLHEGDFYVMSQKAVGCDWKKSSLYTLRHSAGNVSDS